MGRFENNAEKAIEMFYDFTANQLDSWGVKYHQLFCDLVVLLKQNL